MTQNKQTWKLTGLGIIFILFGLVCDIIIQNFGILTLHLSAKFLNLNENTWAPILLMLMMIGGLLYITLTYMKKFIQLVAPDNKMEPFKRKETGWIFKGYGLIILAGMLVTVIKMITVGHNVEPANQLALVQMTKLGIAYKIYLICLSVILAPLLEEAIFRGVLMNYFFKNLSWWINVLLSGIAFGLFHVIAQPFQLMALIQYSLTGVVLAIVYKKTQRLQYSMAAHCLNNSIAILILLT
ncbi:CPBP family intramembrane metalloprotease [Weissella coleopterorum]|uniref:CPBP family intramembrane metalloprotease n=2 Tax=Weissella coleopterorum TaxID=2714949 RepID=A0A6G8AZW7_9LACO|nr:CPBP family intramembrane metalloprotease [Weissella coleopterorum]